MYTKAKIGVIHGRFQPLHLGHMEYLLEGKERCEFLWIGIANPDPRLTQHDPSKPLRSTPSSNPFTYFERFEMIRNAYLEEGVPRSEFEIVPFPINYPGLIKSYVPLNCRFFVTIYDEWGHKKLNVLRSIGAKEIDVMWERSMSERLTTGEEVRSLIKKGAKWQRLVPPAVARIINEIGIGEIQSRL